MSGDYKLVVLRSGAQTLFSASYGEKMHPGLGPAAEAEQLYVRQLEVCARMQCRAGEFIVWDIGLGGAANAVALLRATREITGTLRLVSFDNTAEPLEFALNNSVALNYPAGYETQMEELLRKKNTSFHNGRCMVNWEFQLGDFPALLAGSSFKKQSLKSPDAIFFDAFSPAKNPGMWTLPVFENLFRTLDPQRLCALTTYSRSTLVRVTLLLAGFFVGVGHATGLKEETTIAANDFSLIAEPLNARWLERAARSDSAEPLTQEIFARQKISPASLARLRAHPQFRFDAGSRKA
jgi:S-adenosyl-L-methionine-dependent methyltransferase